VLNDGIPGDEQPAMSNARLNKTIRRISVTLSTPFLSSPPLRPLPVPTSTWRLCTSIFVARASQVTSSSQHFMPP
jgi:hypothetical protein